MAPSTRTSLTRLAQAASAATSRTARGIRRNKDASGRGQSTASSAFVIALFCTLDFLVCLVSVRMSFFETILPTHFFVDQNSNGNISIGDHRRQIGTSSWNSTFAVKMIVLLLAIPYESQTSA
jgi:hypothetical protein